MDELEYLLAADPAHPDRFYVYRLASGAITPGQDGIPPEIVEWLSAHARVQAARLLPEQAQALIEKAPTASLGNED